MKDGFFFKLFVIPLKLFIFQSSKKIFLENSWDLLWFFAYGRINRSAFLDVLCHGNIFDVCVPMSKKDKFCYLNRSQVYRKSIWVRLNHISIYIVLIYVSIWMSDIINLDYSTTILHLLLNRCYLDSFSYWKYFQILH